MFTVIVLAMLRLSSQDIVQRGFILISSFAILSLMLALHLYQNQSWTADILKVVVGLVVGMLLTGRDINETTQKLKGMEDDIHKIKDSITNLSQIEQVTRSIESPIPPDVETK